MNSPRKVSCEMNEDIGMKRMGWEVIFLEKITGIAAQ